MTPMLLFRLLLVALSLLWTIPSTAQNQTLETLDPLAFQSKLLNLKGNLIDVRSREEYESGFIEGAHPVPWNSKEFDKLVQKYPLHMPLFVYCGSGYRSGEAIAHLAKMGYLTIINLEGGTEAWEAAGLKLVTN